MSITKEIQSRLEARRKQREREAREIEELKVALAVDHHLERNEKFEIAWNIAWDHGHSSGLYEVRIYFEELIPLLRL